jgi:hypothetical protein
MGYYRLLIGYCQLTQRGDAATKMRMEGGWLGPAEAGTP